MEYEVLNFDKNKIENVLNEESWPFVYLLYDLNKGSCYVGETINIKNRISQHLEKKDFDKFLTITSKEFNKSFTLDIESSLIELLMCDNSLLLENKNSGIKHGFFEQQKSSIFVENIWSKLLELNIVRKKVNELKGDIFYQLNPLKPLTSNQELVIKEIISSIKNEQRLNYAIQGQPGTGKSLCSNVLFYTLCSDEFSSLKIGYTSGNSQLRLDLKNSLKKYSRYFGGNNIMSPSELVKDFLKTNVKFDYIIVDETQRLKKRTALTNYKAFDEASRSLGLEVTNANELEWINRISENQIVFYDEFQSVKNSDIDIFEALKNLKYKKFLLTEELRLTEGEEYVCLLKNLLFGMNYEINTKKLKKYDFKFFDSFRDMYDQINKLNNQVGKSLILSGLGFPKPNFSNTKNWNSSKLRKPDQADFKIENVDLFWNISTNNWIENQHIIDSNGNTCEIGCIHVIQGQTLNYAAVIVSEEIDYIDGKIQIDISKYNDTVMRQNFDENKFKNWLLNAYYVLLTRGVLGTYVYIKNEGLRNFVKEELKKYGI